MEENDFTNLLMRLKKILREASLLLSFQRDEKKQNWTNVSTMPVKFFSITTFTKISGTRAFFCNWTDFSKSSGHQKKYMASSLR